MGELLSHPVAAMIIMLGVLVVVHELGHFLVGKWAGVGVEVFSIGFGPKVIGFRKGLTEYQICLLPLGGFVKFAGAHRGERVDPEFQGKEMYRAAPWKRALIIGAGPAANMVLAVAAYCLLGATGVPYPPPKIGDVRVGSAAERAGLRPGDMVTAVDGQAVRKWDELRDIVSQSPGETLTLKVLRDEKTHTLRLIPEEVDGVSMLGAPAKQGRAGISVGVPPAIVTVDPGTPAAAAGIGTGDQLVAIVQDGKRFNIGGMGELWSALAKLHEQGNLHTVEAVVRGKGTPGTSDAPPVNGFERHVTVNIPEDVRTSVTSEQDLFSRGKHLANKIGLFSSLLTIKDVEKPALDQLKPLDRVVAWEGVPLQDIYHFSDILRDNRQESAQVKVVRNGKVVELAVPLRSNDVQLPEGRVTLYDLPVTFLSSLEAGPQEVEKYTSPLAIISYGMERTGEQTANIVKGLWGLITGQVPVKALGGPILIAKVAGDSAKLGWQAFIATLSLISINLGLINLLPIPVLDGGQLVLVGAEAVRRRPLSQVAIENFQKVGFVIVLSLVVLALYNDLSRFWISMLKEFSDNIQ